MIVFAEMTARLKVEKSPLDYDDGKLGFGSGRDADDHEDCETPDDEH